MARVLSGRGTRPTSTSRTSIPPGMPHGGKQKCFTSIAARSRMMRSSKAAKTSPRRTAKTASVPARKMQRPCSAQWACTVFAQAQLGALPPCRLWRSPRGRKIVPRMRHPRPSVSRSNACRTSKAQAVATASRSSRYLVMHCAPAMCHTLSISSHWSALWCRKQQLWMQSHLSRRSPAPPV